jgi:hypothetical protein
MGGYMVAGLLLIAGVVVLTSGSLTHGDGGPSESFSGSVTAQQESPPSQSYAAALRLLRRSASKSCRRPYSPGSPWNTPIGPSPAYDPQSDLHVSAIGDELSSDPTQYTYPVYEVTGDTPTRPVRLSGVFSEVFDGGGSVRMEKEATVELPIPAGAASAKGSDRQIVLVNWETGDEWGAWQLDQESDGSWTATNSSHYNVRWDAVAPDMFGARGAGVPYLAGLVRPCEIARGRIDHALAFAYDFPTPEHVYPATKSDGESIDPADMPEGSRLQLDPSLTVSRLRSLGCAGPCLTVARALQRYGMYVIDQSGRPKVMFEYEGTARWGQVVNSDTVGPIPVSALKLLRPCGVVGTPGSDRLRGSAEADVICARGGNDTVTAGAGRDVVYGADGADVLLGGEGDDVLMGGREDDMLSGGPGRDVLRGGGGRDRALDR